MRLRIKGEKIWSKYVEIRVTDAPQGWFYLQALTQQHRDWQDVTDHKNKKVMVRHLNHGLNIFAMAGWEYVDFVNRYKGNNATILIQKVN